MTRNIVAIASFARADGIGKQIVAACDDGTVWLHAFGSGEWRSLPAVPGTAADIDTKRALADQGDEP